MELSNGQRREKGYARSDGRGYRDEGRNRDDRADDRRRYSENGSDLNFFIEEFDNHRLQ